MQISIDISGQITQKNLDSCLGCRRSDGVERAAFLPKRTKREVLKKYTDLQVVSIVEKVYCILVYYRIKDILDDVDRIVVCRDVEFRKVAYLLPLLFSKNLDFKRIKITPLDRSNAKKSNGHYPALKAFRRRSRADKVIKKGMIEDLLTEFKK